MSKNETPMKYELAFQFWRNDGINFKSYDQVANKFGVSTAAISNWAKKYKWRERMLEETKQINENIRRECFERLQAGCEYYVKGIDDIFAEYVRQVLSGERKISDEYMERLLVLSSEIQRGKFNNNANITKSDNTLSDFIGKLGEVFIDGDKQK